MASTSTDKSLPPSKRLKVVADGTRTPNLNQNSNSNGDFKNAGTELLCNESSQNGNKVDTTYDERSIDDEYFE